MRPEGEARYLIVNADDFGLTRGVNQGIIEAHEHGIVTSASLMVRYPTAGEAADYARTHLDLSVGLHFDLGEWRYHNGQWAAAYQVVASSDPEAVEAELERQLARFEHLLGCAPNHLDSHQHVHQSEPSRSLLLGCASKLRVPLRDSSRRVSYCGRFYGQTAEGEPLPAGISHDGLRNIVRALAPGWTELGCHPGYAEGLDSVYLTEREEELRTLCSSETRQLLDEYRVELRSFRHLKSCGS
ncbi:MAG: carbohydrate deacetylase [Chthoniobacterales bacterium]